MKIVLPVVQVQTIPLFIGLAAFLPRIAFLYGETGTNR